MADAPKTVNDLFAGLTPVKSTTPNDPFAGLTEVKSESASPQTGDPFASLTPVKAAGTYSLDEFNAAKEEDLAADKDFSPKDFAADNKVALQKDPKALDKAIRLYEAKDKQSTTLAEKAKTAITAAPKVGKTLVEAFKELSNRVEDSPLSPVGLVKSISRVAGGGIEPEIKRRVGQAVEGAAAIELGALGTADLAKRAARGVAQKVTGEPVDYRQRFFDDVAATEMVRNASQANGEVAKALGSDADTLKQQGIEINPDAVQKLSVVADPTNYIPIAGGVGFIAKVGGKTGKFLLARTVNAEQAAKLASVLNDARKVVSTVKEGAGQLVGSALEGAGKAVTAVGEGAEKAVKSVGGLGSGAAVGGLATGTIPGAAAGIAAAKATPKILQLAGRSAESLGQLAKGARPASAIESAIGGAAKGAAKGALEAGAVTFPLLIGATPEEEENLLGGIGLAGAIRGTGEVAKVGGRVAQNKLTETIYKTVERAETPESPYYGTDGALDTAHATEIRNLPKNEQTVLNYFRNYLKDSGIEIYALDQNTFTGRVPKTEGAAKAKGFFTEAGERIGPDGTGTPVVRILLNGSTDAIGHEIFHALESLDPKAADALRESVISTWTPEQKAQFQELYNTALNGGKPKELWTHQLSDKDVASEVGAEVFGRVLNATDLSGVSPKVQQRAAVFLSNVLEKIGIQPTGEAGKTALGVRGTSKSFSDIQNYLKDLSKRVEETGTVFEGARRPNRLKGATEVTTESVNPAHPLGVGPKRSVNIDVAPVLKKVTKAEVATIKPKSQVEIPVVKKESAAPKAKISVVPEESPRNIRVKKSEQNDFAAKRAEATGAESALKLAKTLGKGVEEKVTQINKSLEPGKAVEIEHSGVKSESTAESPSGRSARRSEQEAAYLAENLKLVPSKVREAHQKVFVPVRWETVGGKPQLIAMSLDKVIANVHRSVADATKAKVADLIPYESKNGKLTDAAWSEVVSDLQTYSDNQSHGYRGDGERLVRPAEDIGASIPAEDTNYSPVRLSEERANFLNLVQGLNPPLTAREVKGAGTPGNVKGQIIAEVNKRTPEIPAVVRPKDVNKQTFKSGRTVKEVNPLRNKLAEAGVPTRELIEVTERINAPDIISVKDRSDLNISAPVTDIIRGGFLPGVESIPELTEKIQSMTPEQWKGFTESKGSLTKGAYELGLGLKDLSELEQLKLAQSEMEKAGADLIKSGDFEKAMPTITKAQFFREAVEAATDTKSAAGRFGWRKAFPNATPPFPEAGVKQSFLPDAIQAVSSLPPVEKGHIRLYHGEGGPQGGGTGGSFYASSPVKASSFGPELSWVDLTIDEAKKAWDRAKKSDFSGGDNFILDEAALKRSKKIEQRVEPPTFELD